MTKKFTNYQDSFFIITILFFILGMIHISFSILGFLCFITPFVLFGIYKDKIWCKYYCPRAGFFMRFLSKISLKKKLPKVLKTEGFKRGVVIYFIINLFFVTMSTIMVSLGKVAPMGEIRFMILFTMPFDLPQLLNISLPNGIIHLGYRMYSIMFSSTIVGLILGILYAPRTWCTICPVQTLTTVKKK
ncbi:hypothetical protein [Clostridium grantii]|uniref:4Fe-4S binding domain-containing protein n=1 Tax=Clostridium grantii DSM 8605 TaxID=1121316 RepID=A0A1M5S718_9CLOT|nr:hypothetical protein [Clostridium grantii]SHH34422.1 hypothetical protein SAMN02745207_00794 [Clostridium grantii DSM 8605]